MRTSKTVVAAALAFSPLIALAGDEANAPFNPYEKSQVGDWAVEETTMHVGSGDPILGVTLDEIVEKGEGTVTVAHRILTGSPYNGSHWAGKHSTNPARTLAELVGFGDLGLPASPKDLKLRDEKRKVGDQELDCKLLSLTLEGRGGGESSTLKLWLSKEIKTGGVVASEMTGGVSIEKRLAGHGTRGKVLLGKNVAAVARPVFQKYGDKDLPLNPFAGAAAGDWLLLEETKTSKSTHEHKCVSLRVVEVDSVSGDEVWVHTRPLARGKAAWRELPPPMASYVYSLTKAPGVSELLGFEATDAAFSDDEVALGESKLAAKRVHAEFRVLPSSLKKEPGEVTVWLSEKVKAGGIVKVEVELPGWFQSDIRAIGYGMKGKTIFGKTPEEALKDLPEEQAPEGE